MSVKVTTYHVSLDCNVSHESRKSWFIDRIEGVTYKSKTTEKQILLEVSYLLQTPKEQLLKEQLSIVDSFEGTRYPICLGDVVRIEVPYKPHGVPADYYLRVETGWEKFNGNVIQLLKHLK